jgi:hypothetical protein
VVYLMGVFYVMAGVMAFAFLVTLRTMPGGKAPAVSLDVSDRGSVQAAVEGIVHRRPGHGRQHARTPARA